mgnify:CR=1 FL=1
MAVDWGRKTMAKPFTYNWTLDMGEETNLAEELKKYIMCTTENNMTYCVKIEKFNALVNVKDVSVYNNKVVEVTFTNNTKEKSICDDMDKFDIDRGIEVCILKYLLGGSNGYNNLIKSIRKKYDDKLDNQKKEAERHEQMKRKRAKRQAAKKRRAERKREEQIEMQKEAYVRAMKEMKNETCQCGKDAAK